VSASGGGAEPAEQLRVRIEDVEEIPDHLTLAPPRPAPRRPGLIPTDIADSIGPVLGKAVADIRAHEDGSRRGGDIEDVHKMRVATRRVRAYLKAARPALDRAATDRLRGDVRELAGTLGVIRDHDVMIDRLHAEAAQLGDPDTGGLEHLISRLETERVAGRDRLVSELDDPSYQALLAELEEAAAQPPVADPWADLRELAADEWWTLQRAHRKLHRTFGKNPPDDELHELRIYGKRARYAAELLHERGDIGTFLEALAGLQEVLGDHQDACVLEDRLRELVDEVNDPHAGIAAGRVIQGCRERRVAARAAYPDAWRRAEAAARKAFPG
jgi:CHAD domain-containing protein